MTIVSDTSPITNLAAIARLDLLQQIYGSIVIPKSVYDELTGVGYPVPGTLEVQTLSWIAVQSVCNQEQVTKFRQTVDLEEAEAIALSLELEADRLLIDDAAERAIALGLGLKITGVLGVLLIAKQRGFISAVKPSVDEVMNRAGFRVGDLLYQSVLRTAGEV